MGIFTVRLVHCLIVLVVLAGDGLATSSKCNTSTVGNRFIFGIIGYRKPINDANVRLQITTTGQRTAGVHITAPCIQYNRSHNVSTHAVITLTGPLLQYEEGRRSGGIEVTSDVPISVAVLTGDAGESNYNLEGFLALPVNALGTRYVAASYRPYGAYSGEILITGVESYTNVTLKTRLNNNADKTIMFQLNKFDTYQFKSNGDISGSIITSNKPIAVFSGCAAAVIPVGQGCYHYIAEQMIPTKYWETRFIVPPIYPRKNFILKVFAIHNRTLVRYVAINNRNNLTLSQSSVSEFVFGTDPVVVEADKPVSLVQYGHDGTGNDNLGDPFMMDVQSIDQFQSSYTFVTQNILSSGRNIVVVTIQKQNVSGLILNGQPVSHWNNTEVQVPAPMAEFVTLFIDVTYNDYFHLYHTGGLKFGAVIYGLPTTCSAYGYPLQLSLNDYECDSSQLPSSTVPSSTSSPVSTSTTSSPVSTTTLLQSTQATTNATGPENWCFMCNDMAHLKYCDRVSRCENRNEVCYVQRYTRSIDVDLYKSGCIQPEVCTRGDGSGGCIECCNGSFCNSVGCGDNGFGNLVNRGPICFDCTHKGADEDCNTVQLCHSDQVCMVEKYEWGDADFHYIRGCAATLTCSAKRSVSARHAAVWGKHSISARHAPVCSQCCHDDFCNMNCTSVTNGPALIG